MNDLRHKDLESNYKELEKCMKYLKEAIKNKSEDDILNHASRINNRCYDIFDILDCIREDEEEL